MAQRAESNNTDKLPWTSPGSFSRNRNNIVILIRSIQAYASTLFT